jgi:hypothetical protein
MRLGARRASGPDALSDAMRAARCRLVVSVFHELHAPPPHAPSCGLPSAVQARRVRVPRAARAAAARAVVRAALGAEHLERRGGGREHGEEGERPHES